MICAPVDDLLAGMALGFGVALLFLASFIGILTPLIMASMKRDGLTDKIFPGLFPANSAAARGDDHVHP